MQPVNPNPNTIAGIQTGSGATDANGNPLTNTAATPPVGGTPQPIQTAMSGLVNNPTLPTAGTITPALQVNTPQTTQPTETGITAAQTPNVNASQIAASQVDPNAVVQQSGINPASFSIKPHVPRFNYKLHYSRESLAYFASVGNHHARMYP